MTEHKADIVEVKSTHDAALAVRARCCGEEGTDSWHTIYDIHKKTDAEIDAALAEHCQKVSDIHAAHVRAKAYIEKRLAQ